MVSTNYPISLLDKSLIDCIMQHDFSVSPTRIKGICRTPLSFGKGEYHVWVQQDEERAAMYVVDTDNLSGRLISPHIIMDTYDLLMRVFNLGS